MREVSSAAAYNASGAWQSASNNRRGVTPGYETHSLTGLQHHHSHSHSQNQSHAQYQPSSFSYDQDRYEVTPSYPSSSSSRSRPQPPSYASYTSPSSRTPLVADTSQPSTPSKCVTANRYVDPSFGSAAVTDADQLHGRLPRTAGLGYSSGSDHARPAPTYDYNYSSATSSPERGNMAYQKSHGGYEDVPYSQGYSNYEMDDTHNYHDANNHGSGGGYQYNGAPTSYNQGYYHNGPGPSQSPPENPFNRHSYYDDSFQGVSTPHSYNRSRPEFDPIDPNAIDDEDDGAYHEAQGQGSGRRRLSRILPGAAAAGAGAGAATAYSAFDRSGSTQMLTAPAGQEKAAWKTMEEASRRKRKRFLWIMVAVIALLLAGGVAAGVVIALRKNDNKSSSGGSSGITTSPGSDSGLTSSSSVIKGLMNNANLHKVFPVIDYTPYDTQYPACLESPPSQDNVTMDLAVLSQLTPAIRFYGTDCNQTQMALTAIDRLGLNDTMKVWLGVWIDNNQTTNDRQLAQMYDVLKEYPSSHFAGVIVGNEVLFRKDQTEEALIEILDDVKSNFTSMDISLSVSTSDLGSSWTTTLAAASAHVMGNIHPFFAGVPATGAASWTWDFWQNNDVAVAPESGSTTGNVPRNIISETGWPSGGGNDCGTGVNCSSPTVGSVAGISEMQTYLNDWVCQANSNGTMYFWFEAFDEPWKAIFNTATEQWEGECKLSSMATAVC